MISFFGHVFVLDSVFVLCVCEMETSATPSIDCETVSFVPSGQVHNELQDLYLRPTLPSIKTGMFLKGFSNASSRLECGVLCSVGCCCILPWMSYDATATATTTRSRSQSLAHSNSPINETPTLLFSQLLFLLPSRRPLFHLRKISITHNEASIPIPPSLHPPTPRNR
jgi:hypothetical protein